MKYDCESKQLWQKSQIHSELFRKHVLWLSVGILYVNISGVLHVLQGRSSFNLEKIKSQDYCMISLHSSSSRIKPCRPDTLQPPAWRIADLPEVRTCIIFHVSSAVYLKEGSRWHLQYLTPLIWLTELQETSPSSLCCRCRSLKELYVLLLMSEILINWT